MLFLGCTGLMTTEQFTRNDKEKKDGFAEGNLY